jgi:hypothetical protein
MLGISQWKRRRFLLANTNGASPLNMAIAAFIGALIGLALGIMFGNRAHRKAHHT